MEVQHDGIPRPPRFRRGLRFGTPQLIGIPLLLALPVLALFGVFGQTEGQATVTGPGVEARVSYPERLRYKTLHRFEVSVRNTGGEPLGEVVVAIDRAYLSAFSETRFTPEAKEITDAALVIELHDIPPGGQRHVSGSVQAEEYGRHEASVRVDTGRGRPLEARLSTIVFP